MESTIEAENLDFMNECPKLNRIGASERKNYAIHAISSKKKTPDFQSK